MKHYVVTLDGNHEHSRILAATHALDAARCAADACGLGETASEESIAGGWAITTTDGHTITAHGDPAMSKVQVASIVCDGPDDHGPIANCPHASAIESLGTVSELRKMARADYGWRTRPGGRDVCPKCVAQPSDGTQP